MLQLVKEGQFYRAQKTSIVNTCASLSAGKRVSANYNFCVVFFSDWFIKWRNFPSSQSQHGRTVKWTNQKLKPCQVARDVRSNVPLNRVFFLVGLSMSCYGN